MKFYFLLLSFLFPLQGFAQTGGGVSGGGDAYAAQFTQIGYDVLNNLSQQPIKGVDLAAFKTALQQVRVTSQDKVILAGAEVDAINTPSAQTILISRSRWDELPDQPRQKFVFVAHEYFSVMGLIDNRYQISHQLFNDPGVVLYRYDCPIADFPGDFIFTGLGFRMQVDLYQNFVNVSFHDRAGKPVDSLSFQNFYSEDLDQLRAIKEPDGKSYLHQGVLISVNLGVEMQLVSLLYSNDPNDPQLNAGTYSTFTRWISGFQAQDESSLIGLTCTVRKF